MIRAHIAYGKYVLRHKWYVFIGCRALGVPLWQSLVHDWVKFLPVEWGPYVRQFYNPDGSKRSVRDATGAYDPAKQEREFQLAWLHHQREPHHWTAWCVVGNNGGVNPLPIPQRFVLELVADWYGAGRAINGRSDLEEWYLKNGSKMVIEDGTRCRIEEAIRLAKKKGLTS